MESNTVLCPECSNANFYTDSDNVVRCSYCGANIFIERKPQPPPEQQQPKQQQPQIPTQQDTIRPIINLSEDTGVLDSPGPDYVIAGYGLRLANYIIDLIAAVLVWLLVLFVGLKNMAAEVIALTAIITIPLYYFIMESINGKTLGKYITGTRAINEDGSELTYGTAFLRTLCRMLPLEQLSIFFSNGVCWHDTIPGTRVIKDR